MMDGNQAFIYYGSANLTPSKIAKVVIGTFTVDGTTTLTPASSFSTTVNAMVIDASTNMLYAIINTAPTQIIKVDLTTFTQVSVLSLSNAITSVRGGAVIDSANAFLYFYGILGSSHRLVKVRLSDFTEISQTVILTDGTVTPRTGEIDKVGGLYYAIADGSAVSSKVVKVDIPTLTVLSTLTLAAGDNQRVSDSVLDTTNGFLYIAVQTTPGRVVKVRTSDLTRITHLITGGASTLFTGGMAALIPNQFLYVQFATTTAVTRLEKIDLATFAMTTFITFNTGETYGGLLPDFTVIDTTTGPSYYVTKTAADTIVKVGC